MVSPTSLEFVHALINGKIDQVQTILSTKDPVSGHCCVNINELKPPRSEEIQTAIRIALYATRFFEVSQDLRAELVTNILDVTDTHGNPEIELNGRDSQGDSVLDQIDKSTEIEKLKKSSKRYLFTRIFNLRNVDGSRVFKPTLDEIRAKRDEALKAEDKFLVDLIEDLRNADGSYVLKEDRVTVAPVCLPARKDNPVVRKRVKETQSVKTPQKVVEDPIIPLQSSRPAAHRPINEGSRDLQHFHNNPQNVHASSIERSVLNSLKQLCKKYFFVDDFYAGWSSKHNALIDTIFQQINDYFDSSLVRGNRDLIKQSLYFIRTQTGQHSYTFLTLKQILCLVWMAANDDQAPCPSNPHLPPNELIVLRKEAIFERLVDAETAYGSSRSCFGGYINNIVSALSQAHECVNVIHMESGMLSAAIDALNFWIIQKIKKLPLEQQKRILCSWDDMVEGKRGPAYEFHCNPCFMKEMFKKLEETFGLSSQHKDEIKNEWRNLPRPDLQKQLSEMLNKIFSLYAPENRKFQSFLDKSFQFYAKKMILAMPFNDCAEMLNELYEPYLELRKSLLFFVNFPEYVYSLSTFKKLNHKIRNQPVNINAKDWQKAFEDSFKNMKKELKQVLIQQGKIAHLKNVLMLSVPVIGWVVLVFKLIITRKLLFSGPSKEKFDLLN